MAYKLKFTPLQAKFITNACLFGSLNYGELRQIWEFSGGEMSKIPSSLIKKLESLEILQVNRMGSDNLYSFDPKQSKVVFTSLGITPEPYSFGEEVAERESTEYEERYLNHDQLLQKLCLQSLGEFKGYSLSFPKDRSFSALVPDAIYQKEESGYCHYLEFDNLTERTVDFSAKLPRYIQYFEQDPQPMSLIYVFKEEPLVRISHLLTSLPLTSTIQRQSTLEWLREHENFRVYFLTNKLWQALSPNISRLPERLSEKLEAFNVIQLLKEEKIEAHLLRANYQYLLEDVIGESVSPTDEEEITLFNAEKLESNEPRRSFI